MSLFLLELLLVELLERRSHRRALALERARGRAWAQGVNEGGATLDVNMINLVGTEL